MKNLHYYLFTLVLFIMVSCSQDASQSEPKGSYIPEDTELNSDLMTPEVLWTFGRIGGVSISPDRENILFGITYYNIEENRSYRDLYILPAAGGEKKRITNTNFNEFDAQWRPDGKKIGYLSSESGSVQLWEINPDGSGKKQVSFFDQSLNGFKYAPDMSKILFISEVSKPGIVDKHPDLPKADARIMDDIMYRHWDTWVDSYSHIFLADYQDSKAENPIDIMDGEPYESPNKPFGGMEQINWTPDSKNIAYNCRKKTGMAYSLSTNSDIYLYNLESGETKNLTEGMMGYDLNPVFSPDGSFMAWESMERDGYEADKSRLFIMDMKSGKKEYLTEDFDQNTHGLAWSDDNQMIYFISDWHATDEIYSIDITTKKIRKITEGIHNYAAVWPVDDGFIATRKSMSKPDEIYKVEPKSGEATELSFVNKNLLDKLSMGEVEKRWVKTTDNKDMLVWVIYPPHFDANKKYPALLYCQGGPQGTVSQFWSYRWNFQMMAANDYIIVAPNRRGLPGFGQEWLEQISGDYGGQNMKDYKSAIDALAKEDFVDENRLGAVGASYGGFSVYWLAGNHDGRFKAFIAHDGMFNLEANYLETEEMWFVNWDLGGPFWDKSNKIAQRSYANSPHKFVDKWDTPILIIHGAKDYRIVDTQGMQAFNAAILRGVPARFLHFPEENHWVLSAQNGILWQRTFFEWLDQWLK